MADVRFCPLIKQECLQGRCVMWREDACVFVSFLELSGFWAACRIRAARTVHATTDDAGAKRIEEFLRHTAEDLAAELIAYARGQEMLDEGASSVPSEVEESFWEAKGVDGYDVPMQVRAVKSKVERLCRRLLAEEQHERIRDKLAEPAQTLAEELFSYARKETIEGEEVYVGGLAREFWESKGISSYGLPKGLEEKLDEVEKLAERRATEEREARMREEAEAEEKAHQQQLERETGLRPALEEACFRWAQQKGMRKIAHQDLEYFLLLGKEDLLPETTRALYLAVNDRLKAGHR